MDLVETLLPGVGIRYELKTRAGLLPGIVVQREGAVEVVVYDQRDPDLARGCSTSSRTRPTPSPRFSAPPG